MYETPEKVKIQLKKRKVKMNNKGGNKRSQYKSEANQLEIG